MTPSSPLSPSALSKAVHDTLDQALATVPPNHDGAVLLDATVQDGKPLVQALIATRIGPDWSIGAGADWSGGRHVTGKVVVAGSWKWPD